jgi:UDP-3-O-[3-hydroxymyristoyl] glucosamine N-acyltransferase
MALTLGELASRLEAKLIGDAQETVDHVATIQNAAPGALTFLSNTKYRKHLEHTQASAVLLTEKDAGHCRINCLVVSDPYVAYAKALPLLYPQPESAGGQHPSAFVDPAARVDASATISAHAVIGAGVVVAAGAFIGPGSCVLENASIGRDTRLGANVTIGEDCQIGTACQIHHGAVIGADGFGFANDGGQWIKVQQIGRVVIGDNVEIGANTTVDRGAIDDTRIESGVKIDNQVQIAHNVVIGENTAIAAATAIAGSTVIGKNCAIGGAVGIVGHLKIADGSVITGMSMVTNSIERPGVYSSGMPAQETREWKRTMACIKRLNSARKSEQ